MTGTKTRAPKQGKTTKTKTLPTITAAYILTTLSDLRLQIGSHVWTPLEAVETLEAEEVWQ